MIFLFDAAVIALTALLLSAGGWFQKDAFGLYGAAKYGGLFAVLLCSLAPPIEAGAVTVSTGAVSLAILLLISQRTAYQLRLVFWAIVTGLAAWQLAEWFPIGRWEPLWMLLPALAVAEAVRGDDAMKRLLLALSPFVFSGCRALMDRFLFGYAAVAIGSAQGLAASLAGLVLLETIRAAGAFFERKSTHSTGVFPSRLKFYPKI